MIKALDNLREFFSFEKNHQMQISKKTILNILLIVFVLSFFVTPLGDYGKVLLNRIFATTPTVITLNNRSHISDYNWKLKDADWNYFNFDRSKGKVVFITFWATWHMPSRAQLKGVQELYDQYKGRVHFYIITDEERADPEEFMTKNGYTFPITYQIIGEPAPIKILKPPGSYIFDKSGLITVHQTAISDWNNDTVDKLLNELLNE